VPDEVCDRFSRRTRRTLMDGNWKIVLILRRPYRPSSSAQDRTRVRASSSGPVRRSAARARFGAQRRQRRRVAPPRRGHTLAGGTAALGLRVRTVRRHHYLSRFAAALRTAQVFVEGVEGVEGVVGVDGVDGVDGVEPPAPAPWPSAHPEPSRSTAMPIA